MYGRKERASGRGAEPDTIVQYLCPAVGLRRLLDVPGDLPLVLGQDPAEDLVRVWRPPHALALTNGPLTFICVFVVVSRAAQVGGEQR